MEPKMSVTTANATMTNLQTSPIRCRCGRPSTPYTKHRASHGRHGACEEADPFVCEGGFESRAHLLPLCQLLSEHGCSALAATLHSYLRSLHGGKRRVS